MKRKDDSYQMLQQKNPEELIFVTSKQLKERFSSSQTEEAHCNFNN